jgi:hypothetical protein
MAMSASLWRNMSVRGHRHAEAIAMESPFLIDEDSKTTRHTNNLTTRSFGMAVAPLMADRTLSIHIGGQV